MDMLGNFRTCVTTHEYIQPMNFLR